MRSSDHHLHLLDRHLPLDRRLSPDGHFALARRFRGQRPDPPETGEARGSARRDPVVRPGDFVESRFRFHPQNVSGDKETLSEVQLINFWRKTANLAEMNLLRLLCYWFQLCCIIVEFSENAHSQLTWNICQSRIEKYTNNPGGKW